MFYVQIASFISFYILEYRTSFLIGKDICFNNLTYTEYNEEIVEFSGRLRGSENKLLLAKVSLNLFSFFII